jgi:hypothetical protein
MKLPCCGLNVPDSVNICLVCTAAILAKLADYLSTEWEDEEMMIYDPAREWYNTDARLAIDAVRKNTAPSLLNIFDICSSNLKV